MTAGCNAQSRVHGNRDWITPGAWCCRAAARARARACVCAHAVWADALPLP
jgi:hypothetical protein